ITSGNDTIEAPYELRLTTEKISNKEVEFKTINFSQNQLGYFFTFDIPTSERINQIQFEFKQKNFDWRTRLEGSQDLKDWFTAVEDYRILSIQNGNTDFQFTKLTFPDSKYRYLRLLVESSEKPQLESATIIKSEVTEGSFRNY